MTEGIWTVETLAVYVQSQFDVLQKLLDERYATQTKAVDAAFLAQQTAMQTALTAAERAVATALLSAEKAVTKAEIASDKRFDAVNEFRQTLSDQATTFISRVEADARLTTLADKLDSETSRNSDRIAEVETRLTSRLDLSQGRTIGEVANAENRRQQTTLVIGAIGALVAIMSIAVAIILGFNN